MSILQNGRPSMAAKRRKKRKTGKRKRKPVAKRAAPKKRKRKKARKRAPVAKAKPVKRRKKRKLSAAHLAKMMAGREAAARRKRKHGPTLTARAGESARGPHYVKPLAAPRFRVNPAKQWFKFCVHSGADYTEQVGYGTRAEAEAKAKALLRGARKVELLGPYFTRAMASKAA